MKEKLRTRAQTDTQGGRKEGRYRPEKAQNESFFLCRGKLKDKTKQINIQNNQKSKTIHKQTGPDAAASYKGYECSWRHCHAVCQLLTREAREAVETLHDRNVAGKIHNRRRERGRRTFVLYRQRPVALLYSSSIAVLLYAPGADAPDNTKHTKQAHHPPTKH